MKDLLFAFMIRLAKITVINILKPGPSVTSVSVISLGMQQAYNFFHHTMETKHFENPASFLLKTLAQKKKGGGAGGK